MCKRKFLFLTTILLFTIQSIEAQVRVAMEKTGSCYRVPCTVNGLRMKFILDTGASVVQLSRKEALFMLDNDYISPSDIVGTTNTQIADGSIVENTEIVLRKMEIGGLTIKNVRAVVSNNMESPLLLGLSAINKLGDISIVGNDLVILNAKRYTYEEIESIRNEANSLYDDGLYAAAAEKYEIIYKAGQADAYDLMYLGVSKKIVDEKKNEALEYLLLAEKSIYMIDNSNWSFLYTSISDCYFNISYDVIEDENMTKADEEKIAKKSLAYAQKALAYANNNIDKSSALQSIGDYYLHEFLNDSHDRFNVLYAQKNYKMALDAYCKAKKIVIAKRESYNGKDENISYLSVRLLDCRYYLKEITEATYQATLKRYAAKGNKYAAD